MTNCRVARFEADDTIFSGNPITPEGYALKKKISYWKRFSGLGIYIFPAMARWNMRLAANPF